MPLNGTERLTGRQRLRRQTKFLGDDLLILQIEVEAERSDMHGDTHHFIGWRDATVEDITTISPEGPSFALGLLIDKPFQLETLSNGLITLRVKRNDGPVWFLIGIDDLVIPRATEAV